MAIKTYTLDMDPALKADYVHDDVANTVQVLVRLKSNNNVVLNASLTQIEALGGTYVEFIRLRDSKRLLAFESV